MKRWMPILIFLVLVLFVGGQAVAQKEKPIGGVGGPVPIIPGKADETEPNDLCGQADGPLVIDDSFSGNIALGGDQDWYSFTAEAGQCVRFLTQEVPLEGLVDTILYLFAPDCDTQLAFNDDGGANYYSLLDYDFVESGTYYLVVVGWSQQESGAYSLHALNCPAAQPNDTCENAIDLRDQGLLDFQVDLCSYSNDVSPVTDACTGFTALGADAIYKIRLMDGELFSAQEDGTHDLSLYLVTDCSNVDGTCVAGSDSGNETESIDYTATVGGWYFLIVDGYSGCGVVTP